LTDAALGEAALGWRWRWEGEEERGRELRAPVWEEEREEDEAIAMVRGCETDAERGGIGTGVAATPPYPPLAASAVASNAFGTG